DDRVVRGEAETFETEAAQEEIERLDPVELQTVDGQPPGRVDLLRQTDHRNARTAASVDRRLLSRRQGRVRHAVLRKVAEGNRARLRDGEPLDAFAEGGDAEVTLIARIELETEID